MECLAAEGRYLYLQRQRALRGAVGGSQRAAEGAGSGGLVAHIERRYQRLTAVRSRRRSSVVHFVSREQETVCRGESNRARVRRETKCRYVKLFVQHLPCIGLAEVAAGGRETNLAAQQDGGVHLLKHRTPRRGDTAVVRTLVYQLREQAGNQRRTHRSRVGAVVLAEEMAGAVCLAVTEVQLRRSTRQVNERHICIFVRHLCHLIHIVHRVVIRRHRLVGKQRAVHNLVELVAEVMFPVATNSIAVEVLAADGSYQHGFHAHRFRLIDILPQVLLVGVEGCRAAVVHGLPVAQLLVQRVLFVAVCAVGFLIVVCKLNQQNIAGCHRVRPAGLQGCPIGSLLIKGFATCARLAAVVHRNLRLIEELLEHLPPASFVGTLAISLHR